MGFLQDAWSWVMMPRDVSFAISEDGVRFDDVGTVANTLSEREMSSTVRDFAVEVGSRRARYVRVRVRHYGNLPAWHPGAGSPAFFFADEIVVE